MNGTERDLEWTADCIAWRGRVLWGVLAHWCGDFDELPVDETCSEFEDCHCFDAEVSLWAPDDLRAQMFREAKDGWRLITAAWPAAEAF